MRVLVTKLRFVPVKEPGIVRRLLERLFPRLKQRRLGVIVIPDVSECELLEWCEYWSHERELAVRALRLPPDLLTPEPGGENLANAMAQMERGGADGIHKPDGR